MLHFIKRAFKFLIALFTWLFVQLFAWLFYDKKYMRSKWFSTLYSEGWTWAAKDIWNRLLFGTNLGVRWPVSPNIRCGKNIEFDVDDISMFSGYGNYFQTINGKISIGKGTYIAVNVGIITTNHDFNDLDKHQEGKDVILGEKCWIGMNSVILPGVVLGEQTIVGAGSVVTKSFPEGHCIIAGNPARIIRRLE